MTTATPAKADRVYNRAPKGGMVDPVTGVFYRGGCFIPTHAAHELAATAKPAPLTGSWLQVAKATRLRNGWLARLDARLGGLRAKLAETKATTTAGRAEAAGIRDEIRRVGGKRWRLWVETDAATIVGRAAQKDVVGLRLAVCA